MAHVGDQKIWMQKQEKITQDLVIFRCGQNLQQVGILRMKDLCAQQARHDKAIDAIEVHMARINQVQELFYLDIWM